MRGVGFAAVLVLGALLLVVLPLTVTALALRRALRLGRRVGVEVALLGAEIAVLDLVYVTNEATLWPLFVPPVLAAIAWRLAPK